MDGGKCETDPAKECVWYRIFQLKDAAGLTADLEPVVPPRSRRRGGDPPR
jgi:hypothetical protein